MKASRLVPLLMMLCGLCAAAPVGAKTVVEAWRSPFGTTRAAAVNPADGSVWAASGSSIMHVAGDGSVLSQTNGFWSPESVSVSPLDGSCWVADARNRRIVHLSAAGEVIWQRGGIFATSVSVDWVDGSCWVAEITNDKVLHLSATGEELWHGGTFSNPESVSANPADGSCWVADTAAVVHLSATGEVESTTPGFSSPRCVSVDAVSGSCWVAESSSDRVTQLSSDGAAAWSGVVTEPWSVSVDQANGSCWVAATGGDAVFHYAADGTYLGWKPFTFPYAVAADLTDGSCWVGEKTLTHISAMGDEVWRGGEGFTGVSSVSANPTNGSCWAAAEGGTQVVHVSADGEELWRGGGFSAPAAVAVNPGTGSCWVADSGHNDLVRLDPDGSEALRLSGYPSIALAVGPTDDSCWVGVLRNDHVVQFSESGTVLSSFPAYSLPYSVSVNPTDGTCWVAAGGDEVRRFSWWFNEDVGSVTGFTDVESLCVDPGDDSCWLADGGTNQVIHLSDSYQEIWRGGTFSQPHGVCVDPADGSCWVTDWGNGQVVRLSATGQELWRGGGFDWPSRMSVDTGDGSCWVADAGNGQLVHLVLVPTVTPTAAFTASVTSGPAPLTVSFTDLSSNSPTSWSWDFGDDGTSEERHPSHTYATAGSYTVSLTARNESGSNTLTRDGYITVTLTPPTAGFSRAPAIGFVPLDVTFSDTSTGTINSWLWDFGDDATSTARTPSHTFASAGRYDVSLTVGNSGGSDTASWEHCVLVTFNDVPFEPAPGYWALYQILACVDAGIVQGYDGGIYDPGAAVNRAQMAVYIARAMANGDSNVPDGPETASFADVPNTGYGTTGSDPYWAYKYIEYCVAHDVVRGYSATVYSPGDTVTRDQMAVFVARARGWISIDDSMATAPQVFPDVPAGQWAGTAIQACVQHQVVFGYENGNYGPGDAVNRDTMAVYVQRAFALPLM